MSIQIFILFMVNFSKTSLLAILKFSILSFRDQDSGAKDRGGRGDLATQPESESSPDQVVIGQETPSVVAATSTLHTSNRQ